MFPPKKGFSMEPDPLCGSDPIRNQRRIERRRAIKVDLGYSIEKSYK